MLVNDSRALRNALASKDASEIKVALSLPRATAELVLQVLEAQQRGGAVVVPAGQRDLTTTQASRVLGVSRPHLTELLLAGVIEHHMVGSHRRVSMAALEAYKAKRDRRHAALNEVMTVSDQLGLSE
jgi:excisionase family DNA binding protein